MCLDLLVDNTSGCGLLRFMDAFSRYNQIRMHPMDEEKTSFMAETTNYCYKVMSFDLKNTWDWWIESFTHAWTKCVGIGSGNLKNYLQTIAKN